MATATRATVRSRANQPTTANALVVDRSVYGLMALIAMRFVAVLAIGSSGAEKLHISQVLYKSLVCFQDKIPLLENFVIFKSLAF